MVSRWLVDARRRNCFFGRVASAVAGLVVVGGLAGSPSAAAQAVTDGGSTWVGPWHAAMGLAVRLSSDSAVMADVLAGAESALALGRPGQALELLSRHVLPDSMAEGAPLAIHAASQYALGAYVEAGRMFDRAAGHAAGLRQGTLRARAAESYERAGLLGRASSLYRQAAIDFPDARGWLALREARVTRDASRAPELLRLAPAAARELAAEVRATWLVRAGDLGGAAEMLAGVGYFAAAGRLAFEAGDNGRARELVYRAIAVRDRDEAMSGVEIALAEFPPADQEGHLAVAKAISRYGRAAAAVRHASDAVTAGDSSIGTLLFYAEVTEASGNRWGALRIYEAAIYPDSRHPKSVKIPINPARDTQFATTGGTGIDTV